MSKPSIPHLGIQSFLDSVHWLLHRSTDLVRIRCARNKTKQPVEDFDHQPKPIITFQRLLEAIRNSSHRIIFPDWPNYHLSLYKRTNQIDDLEFKAKLRRLSKMLDIGKETPLPTPKCYFTCTTLPAYLDTTQQPTKNPPFNLLHSAPYYHTLTLLTPTSSPLKPQDVESKYAKINLSLLEILTGDFFTNKIKKGNVLLVSAPLHLSSTSSSAMFTLVEGVLTITCDRATYERAGLPGTPIPDPHARKHATPKFKIELNLRLPSMLAGKKGFERLLHAARSVFVGEIRWLLYDISTEVSTEDISLGEDVEIKQITAQTEELKGVTLPPFPANADISKTNQDDLTDLLEWLSLAAISSPRIKQGDLVDEIISRYAVPNTSTSATATATQNLTRTTYTGFLPSSMIADIFAKTFIAANKSWFAILVQGFEGDKGVVVLKTQDGRALCWDLEG